MPNGSVCRSGLNTNKLSPCGRWRGFNDRQFCFSPVSQLHEDTYEEDDNTIVGGQCAPLPWIHPKDMAHGGSTQIDDPAFIRAAWEQ